MKKIFIPVLLLFATSCGDDFLEKRPQGQYSPDIILTTAGIEGALVGAYALLDGIGTNGVTSWHGAVSNWIFGSVVSDDAYKGPTPATSPNRRSSNATCGFRPIPTFTGNGGRCTTASRARTMF